MFVSMSSSLRRFLKIALVSLILFSSLSLIPTLAQEISKTPILLDGREVFELGDSGEYSGIDRAAAVSEMLKEAVAEASGEIPVTVTLRELETSGNSIPIIEIGEDQRYLLSVTSSDAPEGRIMQQAQDWAAKIEDALERAQYERSSTYLLRTTPVSLLLILIACGVTWGLGWAWEHWLEPYLIENELELPKQVDSPTTLSTEIGAQVIINALRLVFWLFILLNISRLYPQTRQLSRSLTDSLFTTLIAKLIPLGENSYSVLDLFILIALLVGLIFVSRSVRKILRSRILRFTGLNRAAQDTVAVIFNYTFVFIGTLVILQLWGLDISSLTVFAGVLGVGIGLGMQDIAKEFISGLVLIFERPIQVGDFVDVGGLMGTVERISVRSTEIRTLDQVSIILPNSRFLESEVINWSHHSSISRLRIPVGVAYGSDTQLVKKTLIDATEEYPDVLSRPAPQVFFIGFGDSSLDFNLLVWITEPRKQFQIKSDLFFRVEALLNERNIEIPFPQQDLHIRSGNVSSDMSPDLVKSLATLSNSLATWLDHQQSQGNQQKSPPQEDSKTE